jgi:hypothetical protein
MDRPPPDTSRDLTRRGRGKLRLVVSRSTSELLPGIGPGRPASRIEALRRAFEAGHLVVDAEEVTGAILAKEGSRRARSASYDSAVMGEPRFELQPEASPDVARVGARAVLLGDELRAQVLGGVVHDLSSPLNATSSNLRVALEQVQQLEASGAPVAELREILEDVVSATSRVIDLCADLRAYAVGARGPATLETLVQLATRLTRAHLSRRVRLEVAVPPRLRASMRAPTFVRALAEILVAMTPFDPPLEGPRATLTARANEAGLDIELASGRDDDEVRARIQAALSRLPEIPAIVSADGSTLRVHLALPMSE